MLETKIVEDIRYKKYLYAVYKAMKMIGEKYPVVITKKDENDSNQIEINERNYIIYLSYVLGYLQGKSGNKMFKDDYFINGELYKSIDILSNERSRDAHRALMQFKLREKRKKHFVNEKQYINIRPDFVIHISHTPSNCHLGQKLIVESKTTSKLDVIDFCWDFLKLNLYIDELHFNNALYLIINQNKETIEEMIDVFYKEIKYDKLNLSKIWFYAQNWDGAKMNDIKIYQIANN